MAHTFDSVQINTNANKTIKIPKGFGHEETTGSVVELTINTPGDDSSLFFELYDKKGAADIITKKTAKNFLKYTKKGRYDDSFFHRSVDNFVIQGGGFNVPKKNYLDGGVPDSIKTFSTVKNEPGNPNVTGSIAMAKLPGDPDSATSQWFINLTDNDFLNTDNGGYTVFGHILGDGMKLVETMANALVVPAAEYYQNSALNELPLWEVNVGSQDGNDIANVRPDDFVSITDASKLSKKDSLATYEVSSSDPSLVSVKLGKNNKIKISSGGNQKGKVDVTVTATSRLDGTTTEDSFDVIVGSSRRKRNGNKRQTIDLYIDGGSLNAPYYNIYDSEGALIDDLLINPRNKYTFSRLDGATSHPVYIAERNSTKGLGRGIKVRGDGSAEQGITGDERFKVRFNKRARQRLTNETGLDIICTAHPSMVTPLSMDGAANITTDMVLLADSTTTASDYGA